MVKLNGMQQAAVLSQIILDYADYNLNCWESFADEVPKGAKEVYEAAKALNDVLNKDKK